VQNYIKNEVISKPEDGKKRGYTKVHLTQLILLSYMRPILTTEEIKKVFALAFNEINNGEDDIISWEDAYKIFSDLQKNSLKDLMAKESFNEKKFQNIMKNMHLKIEGKEEERIMVFFVVMSLICQASAIKKLVQNIVNNYEDK
jgi:ERCC4-related helicase